MIVMLIAVVSNDHSMELNDISTLFGSDVLGRTVQLQMGADGKLSPEGIQLIADEVFADQPELKKRSEEFTNACISGKKNLCSATGNGVTASINSVHCAFKMLVAIWLHLETRNEQRNARRIAASSVVSKRLISRFTTVQLHTRYSCTSNTHVSRNDSQPTLLAILIVLFI